MEAAELHLAKATVSYQTLWAMFVSVIVVSRNPAWKRPSHSQGAVVNGWENKVAEHCHPFNGVSWN